MPDMDDDRTTLESLKSSILAFVEERDWGQFHSPKNLSMAIAAEAAELMEHFLWVEPGAALQLVRDPDKAESIRDEVADIIIYSLEFANVAGIDVAGAIREKMTKNEIRYPVAKSRGRSGKYSEL